MKKRKKHHAPTETPPAWPRWRDLSLYSVFRWIAITAMVCLIPIELATLDYALNTPVAPFAARTPAGQSQARPLCDDTRRAAGSPQPETSHQERRLPQCTPDAGDSKPLSGAVRVGRIMLFLLSLICFLVLIRAALF